MRHAAVLFAALLCVPALAEDEKKPEPPKPLPGSPQLVRIEPLGVQRGTEAELTFSGARMVRPQEVMLYRKGLEVVSITEEKPEVVKVTVKVPADAPLGEYPLRLRTAAGVTEMKTVEVSAYPSVPEKEDNNEFAAPQKVEMNHVVEGVVQNEDVDYYVVSCKKGQRLVAEVKGTRLGDYLFDAYVAILDAKRFELAVSDDTALTRQDPVAATIVPEDGDYVIEVRESAYGGNGNCRYRLAVGSFPRPTAVYPPGGQAGQTLEVTFLGDAAGPFTRQVTLPDTPTEPYEILAEQDGLVAPSGNVFRVSAVPNVLEAAGENSLVQHLKDTPATPLPAAFNGVVGEPDDKDMFKFSAKKDQQFHVRAVARGVRSGLDPVMSIRDGAGKQLASSDDAGGPDSYLKFKVPADGDYHVEIFDHLRGGEPDYVYRIEATPVTPELKLGIPLVGRSSPDRQWIAVPRGGRFVTLVQGDRADFGGDLAFAADLPAGVTLHAPTMPGNQNNAVLVFEAAADAPVAGALADLTAKVPDQEIAGSYDSVQALVYGPPNNQTSYHDVRATKLAVAVCETLPFTVELVEPKAPLVQNGSMKLTVKVTRAEGFDGELEIYLPYKPPGVGGKYSIKIPKDQAEGVFDINANGNAGVGDWSIAALARTAVGGGNLWGGSGLTKLTVAEPYVTMKLAMAATEQGKDAEVIATVEQKTPFEGDAAVSLVGLPAKAAAEGKSLNKETKEVVFPVTVAADTPQGQHKSLFCQVVVTVAGEPVVHNVGHGGVLRVDPPPPPEKDEPAKPAPEKVVAKKEEEKKPEKRLTRLEKLRLEAAERRKDAGSQD